MVPQLGVWAPRNRSAPCCGFPPLSGTRIALVRTRMFDMVKSSSNSTEKRKVHKVMKEYKEGDLKSGSGGKVKSRKQAVAIALSEARKAGARIPRKKAS